MAPIRPVTAMVLAFLLTLATLPANAAEREIRVGVYHFPPIAKVNQDHRLEGLLADVLAALATLNPQYRFRIVHTSPKRRYLDFDARLYDVIFFESADWQWRNKPALISPPLLQDEDLFIALAKPGRDQSFFHHLDQRRIVARAGYHYAFADFETDPVKLQQRFHIEFSDSNHRTLQLIKADRPSVAEIGLINHAYLMTHLAQHPEDRDRFLIREQPDQIYRLSVIANPAGPVTTRDILQMLTPLVADGRYLAWVEHWGLQLPDTFETTFPASATVPVSGRPGQTAQ